MNFLPSLFARILFTVGVGAREPPAGAAGLFLVNFDLAAQNRAVFDDDATHLHIASNSAGAPDLDALAGPSACQSLRRER
jgi:hypothetical protein